MKTKPVPSANISKVAIHRSRPHLIAESDPPRGDSNAQSPVSPDKTIKIVAGILFFLELALILSTRYFSVTTGKNFFTERTFFTMFSTMQITAVGLIALAVAAVTYRADYRATTKFYTWGLTAVYSFYLAVDEWFEVHEAVAQYSGQLYKSFSIPLKPSYWDAPLFLVYIAVAALLWLGLKGDIIASAVSRYALAAAGPALALSATFDISLHRVLPVAWEDGFKIVGFMFIGLAFAAIAVRKYERFLKRGRGASSEAAF